MTDILRERQQFLKKELEEYESITPMTDDEREALRWWVNEGHSVHENWSLACWEGGTTLDFLEVYREEMDEKLKLDAMTDDERDAYLREEYGYGIEPVYGQSIADVWEEDIPWAGL